MFVFPAVVRQLETASRHKMAVFITHYKRKMVSNAKCYVCFLLCLISLMEILSSHVAILNLLCEFKSSSMHAQMNEDKFLNRLVTVGWGLSGPVCIQTGLRV